MTQQVQKMFHLMDNYALNINLFVILLGIFLQKYPQSRNWVVLQKQLC